jgi:hypothetical protein
LFLDMLEVPIKHPRENLEERFPDPAVAMVSTGREREALLPDSISPELLVVLADGGAATGQARTP